MAWASLFRQLSNWLWKPVDWLVEVWQGLCIFLSHALKKTLDCSCVGDYWLHLAIKKNIVNSSQNWFEFSLRPLRHAPVFFFFWEAQLTFCAEDMIDFAQWWLDEQTSFRQLSEIYKAEEFMGPRAAHMRNEKEPPSRLFFHSSHSCPSPLTLPAASGMPTVSCDTVEPRIFSQRRLNVVPSCGPPVESMECVIS